jgi:hypothetical protein
MDTEALTQRGWIKGPELLLDDMILTKNSETNALEWQPLTDLKIFPDYLGPVTEFKSRSFQAITTSNHRWLAYNKATKKSACYTTEQIAKSYGDLRIHRTGNYVGPFNTGWTDDEIEFLGWCLTDGSYKTQKRVQLCQCKANNVHAIDRLMRRLGQKYGRHVSKVGEVFWGLSGELASRIQTICPDRCLTMELLNSLPTEQLMLLRDTMMRGDGNCYRGKWDKDTFFSGSEQQASLFQVLCTLTGVCASSRYRDMSGYTPKLSDKMQNSPYSEGYWVTTILRRDKVQIIPKQVIHHETSTGVWCPIVPNTFFVARKNRHVFITGNTPVQGFASDMKLMSMIEIDQKLPEEWGYIIGEVHDSIVLQCKKEFAQAVVDLCVAVMRRPSILAELGVSLKVPIDAEGKMGPSLGKAH